MREALRYAALGALARPFSQERIPAVTQPFVQMVSRLAMFCARARASATSDKFSDVQSFSPVREAPPRLAIQFTKFAKGLALHYGTKDLMDKRICRLVRRVATHTPDIMTMRLIQTISNIAVPVSTEALRKFLPSFSHSTVQSVVQRLSRTGVLEAETGSDGKKRYQLTHDTKDIISSQSLFSNLPSNDPLWSATRVTL